MEVREGCGPLELTRRRRGRIPLRTTLSQIPLKSYGFPGAESARKRFFLRGGKLPCEKISARVRRAGRRPRLEVERALALSRSPGGGLTRILVPDGAGVGRVAPLHSREDGVREGCNPLALSRMGGENSGFYRYGYTLLDPFMFSFRVAILGKIQSEADLGLFFYFMPFLRISFSALI